VKIVKDFMFATLGYMFGARRRHRRLPGDIFRRKIVITIPPWGVLVLSLAITLPLIFSFTIIASMVQLAITATALTIVWRMHRIMQNMRYEVHHVLNDIENEYGYDGDEIDTENTVPVTRLNLKGVNGERSTRVPKR
jgi:hypothetical protein